MYGVITSELGKGQTILPFSSQHHTMVCVVGSG